MFTNVIILSKVLPFIRKCMVWLILFNVAHSLLYVLVAFRKSWERICKNNIYIVTKPIK